MAATAKNSEMTTTIDTEVLQSPEMSLNVRLLRAMGLWAVPSGCAWRRVAYRAYSIGAYTCHVLFVISVCVQLWIYRTDLEQLSDNMSVTLAHVGNFSKIIPLLFFRAYVRAPLSTLRALWDSGAARGSEERHLQAVTMSRVRRLTALYLTLFFSTYTIWELTALVRSVLLDANAGAHSGETGAHFDGNATRSLRALPVRAWYPFDLVITKNFILAFSHQSIGFFYTVASVCTTNVFYFVLIIHAVTQFRVLRESLAQVRPRAVAQLRKTHTIEDLDSVCLTPAQTQALDAAMHKFLADCIHHHQQALKLSDEIRVLMEPVMFAECVTMAIQLCMLIFQATTVPLTSPLFLSELSFLCCEMTQLFLYCLFGTLLISESKLVQEAAYESNWQTSLSSSYRKSIVIMMSRTLRQSDIKALSFSVVSLELFTGLLKASYSFYTLLRQAHDEDSIDE